MVEKMSRNLNIEIGAWEIFFDTWNPHGTDRMKMERKRAGKKSLFREAEAWHIPSRHEPAPGGGNRKHLRTGRLKEDTRKRGR